MLALTLASIVFDVLTLGAVVMHYLYSVRANTRRHDENTALLTFIEVQIRKTRHAVRNLAAALNLQSVVAELDGDGDDLGLEEVVDR